jgi:hypothetical protein
MNLKSKISLILMIKCSINLGAISLFIDSLFLVLTNLNIINILCKKKGILLLDAVVTAVGVFIFFLFTLNQN